MCTLRNWIPAIWEPCRDRPCWVAVPKGVPLGWMRALSDRELKLLVWSGKRSRKLRDELDRRGFDADVVRAREKE